MNQQYRVNGVVYSRKFRTCGKPDCKCKNGEPHGPYWYARLADGSLKYVGSELPESVTAHMHLLRESKTQIAALKEKIEKRRQDAQLVIDRCDRELRTIRALEAGEYCDSGTLKSLGMAKFNGHE